MNRNLIIILTAFIILIMATVVCNSVGDGTKLPTPEPVTVVVATAESNWPDTWDGPLPEIVTQGENND